MHEGFLIRALSLNGRVPNCQLGRSQFESGRAREKKKINNIILFLFIFFFNGINCGKIF